MAPPIPLLRRRRTAVWSALALAVLATLALGVMCTPAEAEQVNLPVPYHRQEETWYCAEASLAMVFDYWGEEVPQHDIGDVANERSVGGTYATDLVKAARFSNWSYSIQEREGGGPRLLGYEERTFGYAAFANQWTTAEAIENRYTDLMTIVREGYPIILLCWLDADHRGTHYRLVKGFDTDTGDFIVHDPLLGSDRRFNMTLLVDDLWTYYDRWGLVVAPWSVDVMTPEVMGPGQEFEVRVRVDYPCPTPLLGSDKSYTFPVDPIATIGVAPPFALASGEEGTKVLNLTRAGDADEVVWRLVSPVEIGYWSSEVTVSVEAEVRDFAISYDWYTDRVGGHGSGRVECDLAASLALEALAPDAVRPEVLRFEVAGGEQVIRERSLTVEWEVLDLHTGVLSVGISMDGLQWEMFTGTEGTGTYALSRDGPFRFHLRVWDRVNNTAEVSADFLVDSTPPLISLFELAGGQAIVTSATIPVALRAEDATTSVELMALKLGEGSWGPWEPYAEDRDLVLPSDGRYTVDVRVRDSVGNVATAKASVTLDSTAPYITLFDVAEGLGYLGTRTVEVTLAAFDDLDDGLEYSLREAFGSVLEFDPSETLQSGEALTLMWTFGGEGQRTLTLVVRDNALNTAEDSVSVVVDSQAPLVTIILNGGVNVTTRTDIPIAVDAIDVTSKEITTRLRVDTNEWGPWSDPSTFRRIDLGPGEGLRTVHMEAQDEAGNPVETSATIWVDSSVPTATLTFTKVRPGGVVAEDTAFYVEFSEPMAPTSVEVALVDNSTGLLDCDLEWSEGGTRLNITPGKTLHPGHNFALRVEGTDMMGNALDFQAAIFATPDVEPDDWELSLTGDSAVLLLLLVFVMAATVSLGYGVVRHRRR